MTKPNYHYQMPPNPDRPNHPDHSPSDFLATQETGRLRPVKKRWRFKKRVIMLLILAIFGAIELTKILSQMLNTTLPPEPIVSMSPESDLYQKIGFNSVPLAMSGGDPYVRALMRSISASESNHPEPYNILYGGDTFTDLSHHPDQCVTIVVGPNRGNCSTAAGRYQFLTSTWLDVARRYHPKPSGFFLWKTYSFEAEYQDFVVYTWLRDRRYWKANIPQLLRDKKINEVLKMLSATWTSLGYGIENNSMSKKLPEIYEAILAEELKSKEAANFQEDYAVIIEYFPKPQDAERVEVALRQLNYQLIIQPTIIANQPTNAIWFGEKVKLEDVKLVAETLIKGGVQIKAIKPFLKRSDLTELRIQVGAESQFANLKNLTVEDVQKAQEFK